ncbi:MAG TPA: TolC family protein, partial [Magnetospirillaceae bacterium]|nr:TolC family protein [Magnetospirillaceae bacterium]
MLSERECIFGETGQAMTLTEAVERALCSHPKARKAWADVRGRAAALGVAEAGYMPTLSGSAQEIVDDSSTVVGDAAYLNSGNRQATYSVSATLGWVLYDFGDREAKVDNAAELLTAAQADHSEILQTILLSVASDYYTAQAALGAWNAARETEALAKDSLDAATTRADKGVSPISDVLQAETAYVQAETASAKAEADWLKARGTLAADLTLRPDTEFGLPAVDQGLQPGQSFQKGIAELIDDAVMRHPAILSAEAKVRAADAARREADAEGWPSISVVAKTGRSDEGIAAAQGLPFHPAIEQDNYVGVQMTIPLFEGFARTYKVRQAEAEKAAQEAALDDTRRQVGLEVWSSYHALRSATIGLENSGRYLDVAQRSYAVALRRYTSGAGTMLELLNVQTSLANARQQRVKSLADWRTSRL